MLTQDRLKELLNYDPGTGCFTRVVGRGGHPAGGKAGCVSVNGYTQVWVDGKNYRAHRLAFLFMTGSFPKEHTDHIDHDRTNNKWINLRQVSRSENNRNCTISKRNNSGYLGVTWCKSRRKWRVPMRVDGKNVHIGDYDCVHEAGAAAKKARLDAGYHQNHGMEKSN